MSKIGVYPGTFDPMTNGHLNIIKRSLNIVDQLIIGVADNQNKTPLLSIDERKDVIKNDLKLASGIYTFCPKPIIGKQSNISSRFLIWQTYVIVC